MNHFKPAYFYRSCKRALAILFLEEGKSRGKVYMLLFSVAGLVLTAGCGSGYRYRWVGPGTEPDIAQVRNQCGGDYLVIGPGELGRIGTNQASLFTEYQAKKTPLALSRYRRLLFIKCMDSKGYRLEPVAGGTKEPVEEIPINVTSSDFDEPSSET